MPRFFLEKMNPELPVITGGDARHIGFSLRMKPGERLTVCAEGVGLQVRRQENNRGRGFS